MPAQHRKQRKGLKGTPRDGLVAPGEGGYDYPRGRMGQTGFPGSTPAAKPTKSQGPDGRKDPAYLGVPRRSPAGVQRQWQELPQRQPGTLSTTYAAGDPVFTQINEVEVNPRQARRVSGLPPYDAGRQVQPPARRKKLTTGPEHRETPVIGADAPGSQNVRNQVAQRYKAVPGIMRAYRAAPNPGKTGARLDGPSQYHPGQQVYGQPDGKPIPGMPSNPDSPPEVVVSSRYVSDEGAQEGYAMNRAMLFTRGGTPAAIPPGADPHIRGGRLSGQRYFGPIKDQQKIGLPSDSYGISRKRGPRHRPVSFEAAAPWTANYYDVAPEQGTQSPSMIHQSPSRTRQRKGTPRGGGTGGGTPRRIATTGRRRG